MTMSARWGVATAKAKLSRVIARARRAPQVIEKRGHAVAVLVGIDEYQRLAERGRSTARWKTFLETSAALRSDGGVELEIPKRVPRGSPFRSRRR